MFDETVIIPSVAISRQVVVPDPSIGSSRPVVIPDAQTIGSDNGVSVPSSSIGSSVLIQSSTTITGGPELNTPDPPSLLTPTPIARFEADYAILPDLTGEAVIDWSGSVEPSTGATFSNSSAANRPIHANTFNIKHGITFDGSNDYLQLDSSFLGTGGGVGSLAIVFRLSSASGNHTLIQRAPTSPINKYFDIQIVGGTILIVYLKLGALNVALGTSALLANVVYVVIIRTTADTKQWTVFINGSSDALVYFPGFDAAETGKWFSSDVGDIIAIGASRIASTTGRPFNGSIAEVIWWDSILSGAEVTSVNSYLTSKWST